MSTQAPPPAPETIRLPRVLGGRRVPWVNAFVPLFFVTGAMRTILISVIPLGALEHLGSARALSVLYLGVSAFGMTASLMVPVLVLRIRTRGVFVLGCTVSAMSAGLLYAPSKTSFVLGMAGYVFSLTAIEVCMNLYTMHRIPRDRLLEFEPRRVLAMVSAFCVGPWLGVWLESRVAHGAPFALTAAAAVAAFGYARFLGLREADAPRSLEGHVNPLASVRRFFSNPLLRLAWAIALARSTWWATFFVYAPVYAVTAGLGETVAGALVSAGVAMVFTVTVWARLGRRHGLRRLLTHGFVASAVASLAVSVASASAWTGAALLLVAAFATAVIDGAGNVPFFRTVRPTQRRDMAGVFNTYRDLSQLVAPGIGAVVLGVLAVPALFGVVGLGMLGMAWYCRLLPRRL